MVKELNRSAEQQQHLILASNSTDPHAAGTATAVSSSVGGEWLARRRMVSMPYSILVHASVCLPARAARAVQAAPRLPLLIECDCLDLHLDLQEARWRRRSFRRASGSRSSRGRLCAPPPGGR